MDAERQHLSARPDPTRSRSEGTDAPTGPLAPHASAVYLFSIEGHPDGSADVRGIAANDTARALSGLDPTATDPVSLDGLFLPPSAIEVLGHVRRAADTGAAHGSQTQVICDGGDASGVATFTPVSDTTGTVTSVVMVTSPTPAPASTEAARKWTGSRGSAIGSFRSERGLGNVFVSADLAGVLGVSQEDALGLGWLDAVHPDDRESVRRAIYEAEENANPLDLSCRIRTAGGGDRWARMRAAPLLGDGGTATGHAGTLEDTTAHHELESRSARFAATLDSTSDLVTYHDSTGRVTYMNAAARAFYGIAADAPLPEMYPADLSDPPAEGDAAMRAVLLRDGGWQGQLTMTGSGGTRITASVVLVANRDADGRIEYYAGMARDISEQRAAEEARRRSEATLRAVVNHSPLGIHVLDDRGRVQLWNPACEQIYGWTAEEVIGEPAPFASPEVGAEFETMRARVLAGEAIEGQEVRRLRKDGSEVRLSVFASPLRDATGRVMATIAVVADVTARVAAERELREREELMRALVESTSDIISIVDRDGTIRYSSRVSERMLGYVEGSAPGLTIFDIVHPDEVDAVRQMWDERIDDAGFVSPLELRLLKADGTWLQVEIVANNLLDDPAVEGVVVTTRDVTERKAAEEALRRRDERFRALVQNLAEAIVVIGPEGEILYNTPTAAAMFGDAEPDGSGREVAALFEKLHPDDRDAAGTALASSFTIPGTVGPIETRVRHADGHWVWVEALAQNLLDDPAVGGVVVTMHDVTDRLDAERLNARQAEILELVARGVPLDDTLEAIALGLEASDPGLRCAIFLLDDDGSMLRPRAAPSVDTAFLRQVERAQAEQGGCLYGASIQERASTRVPDVANDVACSDCHAIALANDVLACWSTPLVSSGSEEALGALMVYAPAPGLPTQAQERLMAVLADVAAIAVERKRYEERLSHQSLHDPLTGLPNRTLFHDRLVHALERCQRTRSEVGVLFLDLDRFKQVNDSLGHDAGDELLVTTAQRLLAAVRPGDTVARFGGDEFTVLCEDLPAASAKESAAEISERLLTCIAEPHSLRGSEVFLGASVGIAIALDAETRPDDLVRDADVAMYHAKQRGKGRWEVFDEAMRERALTRHATDSALHRAIERGELRLFYQPIVSVADQRCVGAEALVRWQHPERGLVLPGEFIGLAEETGLIHDLGRWVLREATMQAARWNLGAPEGFTISVNISAHQLTRGDLDEVVGEALEISGARPERICLEITESVLMDDAESIVELIGRVRDLGVLFSIDDFGTGYSSLGYLKHFPVDVVKIDRSFVGALTSDSGDARIVSAVIGLAHALELKVVAEGVETAEQLAELAALGCDHAQGFYFSPPQPVTDLRRIFARNRWRVSDFPGSGRRQRR